MNLSPQSASSATNSEKGVSFVICSYNGAARIEKTLECLAAQVVPNEVPWEVILVDNASTDGTADVALACWPSEVKAPLIILREDRAGKSYAQELGFKEARYAVISCIDDDNWVQRDWVRILNERMSSNPAIGACGCDIAPVLESAPPSWFNEFAGCYAVGKQWKTEGDITHTRCWLYGAGLNIRRSAWIQLEQSGFRFKTTCRRLNQVSGGGDIELCYALTLAGWTLWLDWNLQMQHYIPRSRLQWSYLRRLYRGAGAASVVLGCYQARHPSTQREHLATHWWWQAFATVKQCCMNPRGIIALLFSAHEGDAAVLRAESSLGRLGELFRMRGAYDMMLSELLHARWRKASGGGPPPVSAIQLQAEVSTLSGASTH